MKNNERELKRLLEPDSFTPLPYWAIVSFLARCGRRVLPLYQRDGHEPTAGRVLVSQAIELAEYRAAAGGDVHSDDALQVGSQFVDNYDVDALWRGLYGCVEAAENTHTDVAIPETEIILAVSSIASTTFCAAFGHWLDVRFDPKQLAADATGWQIFSEPLMRAAVLRDHTTLLDHASSESWNNHTPVPASVFGPMWPEGRPRSWPPVSFTFRPKARIIRTIGDRLISGPEAAVIELIKNSHDADASYVRVTFVPPLTQGSGLITVEDDGHGMTLEDVERKWMEPATTDKRDRKHSPNGRRLLGSKGIGRFATARLGRYLEMESTAPLPNSGSLRFETTRLSEIDWNAFEQNEYLEEVKFNVESLPARMSTGTKLTVSHLRDEWTEAHLKRLHEELRRLISPIAEPTGEQEFHIFLDLSQCTQANCGFDGSEIVNSSSVREPESSAKRQLHEIVAFPILTACDYAVDGVFDETGEFEGTIAVRRADLGPEPIQMKVPLHPELGEQPCGVVLVRFYIFDREADAVRKMAQEAGFGAIGVREARKLLDAVSGVAIYREGFRIRPYGDGENDWLTLDAKRVQNPTIKIGRNQIAGIVSVDSEEASQLIERSSREGLEENGAYRRLQALLSALLSEAVEPRRRQFRLATGLEERKEISFQDVYKQVQLGWSKVLLAKIPEPERANAEELVAKESERLTGYIKRLEDRQAALEAQVTAGLIIGEVMHQGNTPLSFIETETARLKRWWPKLLDDTPQAAEDRREMPRVLHGLRSSSEKLRALFDALSPLSGARRGPPRVFDPARVIADTVFLFRSHIDKLGLKYVFTSNSVDRNVVGYPEDLTTAITNLFDNAVYWLEYYNTPGPAITISICPDPDSCVIQIADNGPGVRPEFAAQIFDVGFTLKPNGTGMGLSIAREAISRSNGALQLVSASGGAAFEISMRYESVPDHVTVEEDKHDRES